MRPRSPRKQTRTTTSSHNHASFDQLTTYSACSGMRSPVRFATRASRGRACSIPSALSIGTHEHHSKGVEGLKAFSGTEHHALEWRVDEVDGNLCLDGDALVESVQHAAAADEMNPLLDEVL